MKEFERERRLLKRGIIKKNQEKPEADNTA
jgi:hypothetical protein